MPGFDVATALRPAGPDAFDVELDGAWSIGGKLNGGYLLALPPPRADGPGAGWAACGGRPT
jgi:hypothetical protein